MIHRNVEPRATLATVRKPWWKWQTPALEIAAFAVFVCWFFLPASLATEKWARAVFLIAFGGLWTLNDYFRDKAWQKLIERAAPELYQKLKGPGA